MVDRAADCDPGRAGDHGAGLGDTADDSRPCGATAAITWTRFRTNWKAGLALNALGMVVLSLLLLNLIFYTFQANVTLRLLSILWGYLILFWLSMQLYVYPFYLALEKPSLGHLAHGGPRRVRESALLGRLAAGARLG